MKRKKTTSDKMTLEKLAIMMKDGFEVVDKRIEKLAVSMKDGFEVVDALAISTKNGFDELEERLTTKIDGVEMRLTNRIDVVERRLERVADDVGVIKNVLIEKKMVKREVFVA